MDGPDANTPGKRLKWARESRTAYATATDAARAFGWKVSTYLGHENGDRKPSVQAAKKYGAAYKIPWAWILDGSVPLPPPTPEEANQPPKALIDLLMHNIYDPAEMPKGSAEEKAVHTLARYLRKRAA
jgi:transcriptional regulator with XRE-family HTH domain